MYILKRKPDSNNLRLGKYKIDSRKTISVQTSVPKCTMCSKFNADRKLALSVNDDQEIT